MGVISTAAKHLIAAGVTGNALVLALEEIEANLAAVSAPALPAADSAAERRRAYDRERKKRKKLENSTGIPPENAEIPGSERNSTGTLKDPSLSLPPLLSPQTPQITPPTHTHPDISSARESEPAAEPKFGPQEVVDLWNKAAPGLGLAKVAKLSDARRAHAKKLIREHGADSFTEAISAISRSPFLMGDNDRGWKADFDFFLQPSSFLKLIEGSYDRRNNRKPAGSRYEPDGAMAHLQRNLGLGRDPESASEDLGFDDGAASGRHRLLGP